MAGRVFAITVGGETRHRRIITTRCAFDDEQQQSRRQNGAHDLGHYIAGCILRLHLLADEYADSHGRIDVAARNGPDGINHCEQGQAESERDTEKTNLVSSQNSTPTTGKHKYESAHE